MHREEYMVSSGAFRPTRCVFSFWIVRCRNGMLVGQAGLTSTRSLRSLAQ